MGPLRTRYETAEIKYVRLFSYSRVGNAVTFPTVPWSPEKSKGGAIGEGVPVSGTASLRPGCIPVTVYLGLV